MNPLFSVIITTYQRQDLILRAINSLKRNTHIDWEAIIIDDGSTDGTEGVLKSFVDGKKIRYICQDHTGTSGAKNRGIQESNGEYITFLDSDDEYTENHLMVRKSYINSTFPKFLYGGFKVIGDVWVPDIQDNTKKIKLSECIVGGTFVIHKTVFNSVGLFDDVQYGEDLLFFRKVELNGIHTSEIFEETYIYHRDTPNSITNKLRGQ
jgi:glycosyltransferase involved in cell wall biosynthesis